RSPRVEIIMPLGTSSDVSEMPKMVSTGNIAFNNSFYTVNSIEGPITAINNVMFKNQLNDDLLIISESSEQNGFGPISPMVRSNVRKAYYLLSRFKIKPHNMFAIDDGGISIEFSKNDFFYCLSFYN